MDTKHILAWVKQNNPKAYLKAGRFDKDRQPAGDPDCRLGCKKKHNLPPDESNDDPPTPTTDPKPAGKQAVGEYYWGYASGLVATKVPGWGEFVLAELTQTFDKGDATFYRPLMDATIRRLGRHPRFGAFNTAFDTFYVYDDFNNAGGFAAVPLSKRGAIVRTFDSDGLPLCQAGLAMPLRSTFINKTSLVEHQRGRYACPLLFPEPSADACPIAHPKWPAGGCLVTMATNIGARLRYQLDRDSDDFKAVYRQRTASERINSLATELGIEQPKLRNRRAIANHDTLIYVLLNLRGLQRVRKLRHQFDRQAAQAAAAEPAT